MPDVPFCVGGTVLRTARLTMRAVRGEDLRALFETMSAENAGDAAGWHMAEYPADARRLLRVFLRDGHTFALLLRDSCRMIGVLDVRPAGELPYADPRVPLKEIRFALAADVWGWELMPEAIRAAALYLFTRTEVRGLIAYVPPENVRAVSVLEKVGFTSSPALPYRILTDGPSLHADPPLIL